MPVVPNWTIRPDDNQPSVPHTQAVRYADVQVRALRNVGILSGLAGVVVGLLLGAGVRGYNALPSDYHYQNMTPPIINCGPEARHDFQITTGTEKGAR